MPTYTVKTPSGGTKTISYSAFRGSKGTVAKSGGSVEAYGRGISQPGLTAKEIKQTGGTVATTSEGITKQAKSIAKAQTKLEQQQQAGQVSRSAKITDIISPIGGAYSGRYIIESRRPKPFSDTAREATEILRGSKTYGEAKSRILSSSPKAYATETSLMTSDAGIGRPSRNKTGTAPTFLYDAYLNKLASTQKSEYIPFPAPEYRGDVRSALDKTPQEYLEQFQNRLNTQMLRAKSGTIQKAGLQTAVFGVSAVSGFKDLIAGTVRAATHPVETIKSIPKIPSALRSIGSELEKNPALASGRVAGQVGALKAIGIVTSQAAKVGSSAEAEISGLKIVNVRVVKQAGGVTEYMEKAALKGVVQRRGFLGKIKTETLTGIAREKASPAGNVLLAQKGVLKLIGTQTLNIGKKFKVESIVEGVSKPLTATKTDTTRFVSSITAKAGKTSGVSQIRIENLVTKMQGKISTTLGASKKIISAKAKEIPSLSLKKFEKLYPSSKIDQIIYGKARLYRRQRLIESPDFSVSKEISIGVSFSTKLQKYVKSRKFSPAPKAKRYSLAADVAGKTKVATQKSKTKLQRSPLSSLQTSLQSSIQQVTNDIAKASRQTTQTRARVLSEVGAAGSKAFLGRVPELTRQQTYPFVAPPQLEKMALPPQATAQSLKIGAVPIAKALRLRESVIPKEKTVSRSGGRQSAVSRSGQVVRDVQRVAKMSLLRPVVKPKLGLSLRNYQGQIPRQSVKLRIIRSLQKGVRGSYGAGTAPKITAPPPPPPPPVLSGGVSSKSDVEKYIKRVGFGGLYVPSVEAILRNIRGSERQAGLKGIGLRPIPTRGR